VERFVLSIAPEIQSFIDWGVTINDRHRDRPLPELRRLFRDELDRELRRLGVVVEDVEAVTDHEVAVAGGEIRVRVFAPPGAGPHPGFLHFHGGGFVFGTIDSLVDEAKCAHLCSAAACLVVTVEYRLAPEFPFPTAPEDCFAALQWTVEHADRLGLDPSRIAVGGESAGGNLAAVVALMARDRNGPAPRLQLLEVPVTDMNETADDYQSVALFGEGYGLDRVEMRTFTDAYLADPADGSAPYASPLVAPDLEGIAPAHVLVAEYDVLRDSGEAYARRLENAGVTTTLRRFLGHTHASSVLWQTWEPARAWMDEVVDSLRHALHDTDAQAVGTKYESGAA
jgi:acetyl esterase